MRHSVLALVAAAGLASPAMAGIITVNDVVVYSLMPAPGTAGAFFAPTGSFSAAGIDGSGNVWFRSTLLGGDATTSNPYNAAGWWSGTNTSNVTKIVRDAEQPAGLPAGVTIGTSATVSGLGSTAIRTSSGTNSAYGVQFLGTGITSGVNESAIYVGSASGQTLAARRGDSAPGTTGATYNTAWRSFNTSIVSYNGNDHLAFQAALTGGDSVAGNNAGIFAGPVGSIGLVARKGDTVDPGVTIGSLGSTTRLNAGNKVVYDLTLAGAGVSASNDSAIYLHTPGSGNARIYREGDPAPGTAGAVFSGQSSIGSKGLSTAGMLYSATLAGGDVVGTTNDTAMYHTNGLVSTLIVREGTTAAPGTDGLFGGANNPASFALTNSGWITMQSMIVGGSQTITNDSGMWGGFAGALNLIIREGDPALGTSGAMIDNLVGLPYASNNSGHVVISVNLLGGDVTSGVNSKILYGYTPGSGLTAIARTGDSFEVSPGVFKTISALTVQGLDNGGGASQSLNDLGYFSLQVSFTDNSQAIVRGYIPAPGVLALGALGSGLTLRRRRR